MSSLEHQSEIDSCPSGVFFIDNTPPSDRIDAFSNSQKMIISSIPREVTMSNTQLSRGGMFLLMVGCTLIMLVLGIIRLVWSPDGLAMVYLPLEMSVLGIVGLLTLTHWPHLGLRRFNIAVMLCIVGLLITCSVSGVSSTLIPHTLIVSRGDPYQVRKADGWTWYQPFSERLDYIPAKVLIENEKFGVYFTAQEDPVQIYKKFRGPTGYMDTLQTVVAELTRDIQQDQYPSIREMAHATTLRLEYGLPVKGKVEVLPKMRSGG